MLLLLPFLLGAWHLPGRHDQRTHGRGRGGGGESAGTGASATSTATQDAAAQRARAERAARRRRTTIMVGTLIGVTAGRILAGQAMARAYERSWDTPRTSAPKRSSGPQLRVIRGTGGNIPRSARIGARPKLTVVSRTSGPRLPSRARQPRRPPRRR